MNNNHNTSNNHNTTKNKSKQVEISFFSGKYPSVYKHTCEQMIKIVGNSDTTKKINLTERAWRERESINRYGEIKHTPVCLACQHEYIYRLCKQIETEMNVDMDKDWYISFGVSEKIFSNYRINQFKKGNKIPYLAIPQSNKSLMVFHNEYDLAENVDDSVRVKMNKGFLYRLTKEGVLQMPDNSKVRRSFGFGKQYQGYRGYGDKDKAPQYDYGLIIKDKRSYRNLLHEMDINLNDIGTDKLIELLRENFVAFKLIKGNIEPPEPDFTEWTPPEYDYVVMEDEPVGW